jgi:hypothetical protein
MFLRAIPVIALVTSLSACGGSSDGSAVNPVPPPNPAPTPTQSATVLETFSDGSGVLRQVQVNDGLTFVSNAMAGDIQTTANFINSGAVGAVDIVGGAIVASNQYGNFAEGTLNINGQLVPVTAYVDYNGVVSIAYASDGFRNVLLAGGYAASNMPSGTYTYSGTNVIGTRDGVYAEDGTFTMAVNFDTGQAAISGGTPLSLISGSNIAVNNANGTFSSSNINLTIADVPLQGTINGNFHGNGAVGVTGIYHENDPDPIFAGAIAGTR